MSNKATKTIYLTKMPYGDAKKIVDYANNEKLGDAFIIPNAVCLTVTDEQWNEILLYIEQENIDYYFSFTSPNVKKNIKGE